MKSHTTRHANILSPRTVPLRVDPLRYINIKFELPLVECSFRVVEDKARAHLPEYPRSTLRTELSQLAIYESDV